VLCFGTSVIVTIRTNSIWNKQLEHILNMREEQNTINRLRYLSDKINLARKSKLQLQVLFSNNNNNNNNTKTKTKS